MPVNKIIIIIIRNSLKCNDLAFECLYYISPTITAPKLSIIEAITLLKGICLIFVTTIIGLPCALTNSPQLFL